jgi:malate dehydrogenase
MELQDSAYELVQSVMATTDTAAAFQGVQVAILLGGFPRKEGMERRDLIEKVCSNHTTTNV